jgi:hypothetical protein
MRNRGSALGAVQNDGNEGVLFDIELLILCRTWRMCFMRRLTAGFLLVATPLTILACAPDHHTRSAGESASGAGGIEAMDDQYESPPWRDTISKVMQAKLAHTQAVLEGLTMADYSQVEVNAMALKGISREAEWLAHDSIEYFELSADFRNVCDNLALHARAGDMQATVVDYGMLTNSCVGCHDYLRLQRQNKDMPGRVSDAGS